MSRDKVMIAISRIEHLTSDAEQLVIEYPKMFKSGIFKSEDTSKAELKYEAIINEIYGIIGSINQTFEAYGLSIENQNIKNEFHNNKYNPRGAVSALHMAIGFLREKARQL